MEAQAERSKEKKETVQLFAGYPSLWSSERPLAFIETFKIQGLTLDPSALWVHAMRHATYGLDTDGNNKGTFDLIKKTHVNLT